MADGVLSIPVRKFPAGVLYYSQLIKVVAQLWLFPLHINRAGNNSLAVETALRGLSGELCVL